MQQRNNPFRRAGGNRPLFNQRGENFMDRLIRDANQQNLRGLGGNPGFPQNMQPPQNAPNQPAAENISGTYSSEN